jgi:hypothetical protein
MSSSTSAVNSLFAYGLLLMRFLVETLGQLARVDAQNEPGSADLGSVEVVWAVDRKRATSTPFRQRRPTRAELILASVIGPVGAGVVELRPFHAHPLTLGAVGVNLRTRFLATVEAPIAQAWNRQ